jgi:hypothetical protein
MSGSKNRFTNLDRNLLTRLNKHLEAGVRVKKRRSVPKAGPEVVP